MAACGEAVKAVSREWTEPFRARRLRSLINHSFVDDIGMLPSGQSAAEAFYRLVDATYERRSLAVTSNIHPAGFDTIMPKILATAAVDRLLHHAHVIITEGTSLRLAEATAGRGVVPLN